MKGRLQAVAVAGLAMGTLVFAWVGAAAAALVMLRKGVMEGGYVVAWALLPAVAVAMLGADVGPLTMLLGAAATALVLRNTRSWPMALVAAVASGYVVASLLYGMADEYLASIMALIQPMLDQFEAQMQGSMPEIGSGDVAAVIGASTVLWSVLAVMLARWWQAMLYNPGGFRQEMWQLRLPPAMAVGLVIVMLLVANSGAPFRFWGVMCLLPFAMSGLALVHGTVGQLALSGGWLVMFYIALLLLSPLWMALVFAAIVDSWIDIRGRLPQRGN